jgi:hypothetical protein
MKIDRHSPSIQSTRVKLGRAVDGIRYTAKLLGLALICVILVALARNAFTDSSPEAANHPASRSVSRHAEPSTTDVTRNSSQPQAVNLLRQVLSWIVNGPAFDAKVRETVWTTGREVVGVGTYEQSGGGSGRYNLQVTMHDGEGKHRLQQISDGRLAWTRTEISGNVSLRRVDVGRLDEWVKGATSPTPISPRLKVGAWGEMLSTIERDYVLRVDGAHLKGEPVWVLSGTLRDDRRDQVLAESARSEWPMLYPTRVRVAVKSKPDSKTGFGAYLPVRIEYWSDPIAATTDTVSAAEQREGRLITLIELYSIRPISPPPPQRFRFENQDAEVNFTNETDRYIRLHDIHLTQRQRRQLRR